MLKKKFIFKKTIDISIIEIYTKINKISKTEIVLMKGEELVDKMNLDYMKKRRIELGLSQQYMANELGFKNASTYLKYENGDYAFKAEMLPLLAKILKVNMKNFFYKLDC